jgi:alpha-glucosidase (family GH31 glycosyl hydrolase)
MKYDGFWLDMNDVSNFCDGECIEIDMTDGILKKS